MGNVHIHRGRLLTVAALALLIALSVFAVLMLADNASAQQTWSATTCGTCHNYSGGDAFHAKTTHASQACSVCHSTGYSTPNTAACGGASCHGSAAQVIASQPATHTSCTGSGCHTTTTPTPTPTPTATTVATTLTAKASPAIVRLNRKVKVSGLAGPVPALAAAKVALKVERKVGTRWVKMKTATVTTLATGAYAWNYKATKKGAHRVTVSIAKTATFTAKKVVKTFKVK